MHDSVNSGLGQESWTCWSVFNADKKISSFLFWAAESDLIGLNPAVVVMVTAVVFSLFCRSRFCHGTLHAKFNSARRPQSMPRPICWHQNRPLDSVVAYGLLASRKQQVRG